MSALALPGWPLATGGGDRRHPATPRRLQRAREQGQNWRSPDFTGALAIAAGLVILKLYLPWAMSQLTTMMVVVLKGFAAPERLANLSAVTGAGLYRAMLVAAPMVGGLMLIGVLASAMLSGFRFSTSGLQMQLQRIDPIQGLVRIFSVRGLWDLLKGLLKLAIVGSLAASAVLGQFHQYAGLAALPLGQALGMAGGMLFQVLIRAAAGFLLVGAGDAVFQYFQFQRSLRMTEREMRDETRETEGDMAMRRRRRQEQRRMLRAGLSQVAKASVVVTNPTHLAVALRYDPPRLSAPVVVAKGEDDAAFEIRRAALRNEVPIMQNAPLAQQLYRVPLGEAIPEALYRAVAEVLAFVMRRRPRGGVL